MRTLFLLLALVLASTRPALAQETLAPEGTRISVAGVVGIPFEQLTPQLRADIATLAGTPLRRERLQELAQRIEREKRELFVAFRSQPGPDGSVSNGNRRLAMLKRLQAERGADGYDRVDVVFMDEGEYDEDTIFEMEAREQLTEGLKLRYTEMNSLLTLRDAAHKRGVNWNDPKSIADVARLIRHLERNSANYAKVQLLAVKYMTDYLEWRGTPGDFGSLRRMVERFRDLGKNMEWVTKNDSERETAMMLVCFLAIDAGAKHGELRAIRLLAQTDPEGFDRLANEVEALWGEPDEEIEVVVNPAPPEPAGEPDEDGDDDEEDEESGPQTAKQGRIRQAVRGAAEALRAKAEPPEARVRAAASGLGGVDPAAVLASTAGVAHDQVRQAMAEVIAWAEVAEDAIKGNGGGE